MIVVASLLAIGIAAHNFSPPTVVGSLVLCLACGGGALLLWRWRYHGVALFLCVGLIVSIGAGLVSLSLHPSVAPHDIRRQLRPRHDPFLCEGIVAERPVEGIDRARVVVALTGCRAGAWMEPTSGRVAISAPVLPERLYTGDRVRFLAGLHPPRAYRNPGGDPRYWRTLSEGIAAVGFVADTRWVVQMVPVPNWSVRRWLDAWALRVEEALKGVATGEAYGVLVATITGNGRALSSVAWDRFRRVGVLHLLVISGFHVSCVAFLIWGLLYGVGRRSRWLVQRCALWKWAAGGSLVAVWVYAGFVGGTAPVLRAAVMISIVLVATCLDRRRDLASAIALAAILILFAAPLELFLPSFQLTFGAVIGIVGWWGGIRHRIAWCAGVSTRFGHRLRRWVIDGIGVTLGATVGVTPLVAYHFHGTSWMGVISNIALVPLYGLVLTPLGLLYAIVLLVVPTISAWLAWPMRILSQGIVDGVAWADQWSAAWQMTWTPYWWEVVGWYCAAALPLVRGHRRWRVICGVLIACVGVTAVSVRAYDTWGSHPLTITFLDVGQGSAAVIRFPNRRVMVIDAGGIAGSPFDVGRWVVAPALHRMQIHRIDTLTLTHHHPDHYGGIAHLAETFAPRAFWTNGAAADPDDPLWPAIAARIAATGVVEQTWRFGAALVDEAGVTIQTLHPGTDGPRAVAGQNNNSLVHLLTYGGIRILLTGDIEREAEAQLVASGMLGPVDLLQVPHHGSNTSSTPAFLAPLRPRIAVISCGQWNRYDFPRSDVLQRYAELGTHVYRTDRDGAVTVRTDGRSLQVSTYVTDK